MADLPEDPGADLDYAPGEQGQPGQGGVGGRGGAGGVSRPGAAARAAAQAPSADRLILEAGKYFLSGHKPNSIMGGRKGAQRLCDLRTDANKQLPSSVEQLMSGLNLITNNHPGVQNSLPNKQAIINLQKQLGVKADGVFGPKSFRALVGKQYPHLAGKLPKAAAHAAAQAGAPGQAGATPAQSTQRDEGYAGAMDRITVEPRADNSGYAGAFTPIR